MQQGILNRILKKFFQKENRLFLYLSVIIILILFLSAYAGKWSSNQSIDSFIITGNKFIPTEELLGNVDSSIVSGIREDVELLELKDKIVRHPYVQTSFIIQKSSSVIEIEVKERMPIAILVNKDGGLSYCDAMANVLPYRLSLQFQDMPIVRNIFKNNLVDTNALESAVRILKEMKKQEYSMLMHYVSELNYERDSKTFSIITTDNACIVKFGTAENIREKLQRLSDFYEYALQDINVNDIRYIDVRWDERIIVQTKQVVPIPVNVAI